MHRKSLCLSSLFVSLFNLADRIGVTISFSGRGSFQGSPIHFFLSFFSLVALVYCVPWSGAFFHWLSRLSIFRLDGHCCHFGGIFRTAATNRYKWQSSAYELFLLFACKALGFGFGVVRSPGLSKLQGQFTLKMQNAHQDKLLCFFFKIPS